MDRTGALAGVAATLVGWVLVSIVGAPLSSSSVSTIRGVVQVPHAPRAIARRPSIAALGMPLGREGPDRRRSVVYLDTTPNATPDPTVEANTAIDQRGETFVPHVLAVKTGTIVDFPNSDETYHNVFSLSRLKPFDLGRYAAGRSKSVRFDRPGIVRVFCDIHSHMSAFVLVFSHRLFAVTDDEGRYRIDGVSPGSYTIVAWNESVERATRQIEVPDAGGELEVSFVLGVRGERRALHRDRQGARLTRRDAEE